MRCQLPKLPYHFDALEPYIDEETMRVHHDGHHRAYVEKLNTLLGQYPALQLPVEELLVSLDKLPQEIQADVRNNAGGHANHSLFWTLLTPQEQKPPGGGFCHASPPCVWRLPEFQRGIQQTSQ